MGVQEYRTCLHRRLPFTLLMINMLGSINISVAQCWSFALTNDLLRSQCCGVPVVLGSLSALLAKHGTNDEAALPRATAPAPT